MIECVYCWRVTGHYEILKFDPTNLSNSKILEKAAEELRKKFNFNDGELVFALENIYLLSPVKREVEAENGNHLINTTVQMNYAELEKRIIANQVKQNDNPEG